MTAWKPGTIWVCRQMGYKTLRTSTEGPSAGHIQMSRYQDKPPDGVYDPLLPGFHFRGPDYGNPSWTRFNPTDEMIDMLQPWIGHLWGEP